MNLAEFTQYDMIWKESIFYNRPVIGDTSLQPNQFPVICIHPQKHQLHHSLLNEHSPVPIKLNKCYEGCSPTSEICFTVEDNEAQVSTQSARARCFALLDAAAAAAAEAKSVMLNTNWRQPNLMYEPWLRSAVPSHPAPLPPIRLELLVRQLHFLESWWYIHKLS